MNEHEDIKKISYAIDEMMFRYLAVLRPMQAAAVESKVGYHLLKRPVNTILAYLNNHDGEGVCSLAKNVAVSEKSIGRYIKQMTDLGLLERSVDTEDLRVGRIFITQKGRDIMNEQEEFAFDYMEKRFCGGLSSEEREELIRCCGEAERLFAKVLEYGKTLSAPGDKVRKDDDIPFGSV